MHIRRFVLLASALIVAGMPASQAYVLNGPKWAVNPVPYYINPANNDVSQDAAIAAIQAGASSWSTQSNARISLQYMGQTSGTSLQNNGKNELFFRNTSNGGIVAETYWWADSSNRLIDADVVYYDGGFTFFTAGTACSAGIYLEGVTTHELGHALGLGHSSVGSATMYPSMSWCSNDWQTLDQDDLNAIEAVYPPASGTNTPPSVAITGPAANSTFEQGTAVTVTGSASDQQDGTISSRIAWSSSIDGALGTGSSRTWTPSAGNHVITARVTDNNGATTTDQESVIVNAPSAPPPPPPPASGIALTASGFKTKGSQQANLQWSGATSASVDVFRNNVWVMTTANDGSQTDPINRKGSGTYSYKVCEAGTATCSNVVNVVF